jgi:hypothetical protein
VIRDRNVISRSISTAEVDERVRCDEPLFPGEDHQRFLRVAGSQQILRQSTSTVPQLLCVVVFFFNQVSYMRTASEWIEARTKNKDAGVAVQNRPRSHPAFFPEEKGNRYTGENERGKERIIVSHI